MIRYVVADAVATITIDDPQRRNPLSNDAMAGLAESVARAAGDDSVAVVVLTGAGDRAFSSGGDLSGGFVDEPLADHASRQALARVFRSMWSNPKPIVGRINGAALGGGFGLAVACDITIACDDAKLGTPEISVGLWPMMISAVLVRSMPRKALLEMMLTGTILDAARALDLGLVNRVVPRDRLDDAVTETVGALLARSPAALALGKRTFYAMADLDVDSALDLLHIGLTATALTEDAAEGIAAFAERRDPTWKGR